MTPSGEPTTTGGRTMRAALLDRFGDASALRIGTAPAPTPVLSEVLVRVMAAGVNPLDTSTRAGDGAAAGIGGFPAVLGSDFSGVVVTAPYESFELQPGDEVYGVSSAPRGSGSFAELVAVPPHHLALKPKVLTHAEAAAVPLAALTAWGAVVELAHAHAGQRILVHAGAGGVGHFAVQLAAYFGATVIATTSAVNEAWVRSLGADEVVDYHERRFEEAMRPVDAVIDLVGDRHDHVGPRSLAVLRPGGLLVTLPSTGWPTLAGDAAAAGVRATKYRMVPDNATLAVITRLLTSGDLKVAVQEEFPFDRIADAQRLLESGHVRGKIVVRISDY
ncbi:NADP-dependent oxidoreductase [Amnibacterium sp.]|uniref:NADP-dependent oxidoreductase n=1 Tax=Amnibacterium sp. TaxID=1872496 RepID=UPI0026046DEF|nr:NADP-dependent oxidoreductase [Amnibacterium sp.]MCU1472485.1 zinc-binding oxidoreductase [Amnibacterium sp.]